MTLQEITTKFASELADFEKKHGKINGGFVTGLFAKLAAKYADSKSKEAWNAAREQKQLSLATWTVKYADYKTYKTKQNA